ncbi:MAG: UDP-N-acetylenolpyruvoylglucosamine reductase [Candidatus Adlerbacteria bacterium]|nr:UDP-N-acetylenolpyruvoylglucosamine reductase [Candidatus Adlerbacteria bacterium]
MQENVPLAEFTTFKLGGPARFFVRVSSAAELQEALAFGEHKNLAVLVFGGGSNLLIGEKGFDGLVIKIELHGISAVPDDNGNVALSVAAGENWDELVAHTCAQGWWGLENLSGIPGTVGAAPVQNIGAYGADISHTCTQVEVYDRQCKQIVILSASECAFAYRDSMFKQQVGRYIIMRVYFALSTAAQPNTAYRDLSEAFSTHAPTMPQEVRAAVLAIRARKFPDLNIEGTAGSFFVNPVVSAEKAAALAAQYPDLPQYDAEGGKKVSLAWILDKVLNAKGMSVGGARLFEKQPLVVATNNTATADNVMQLKDSVIAQVKEKVGIDVDVEVRIII